MVGMSRGQQVISVLWSSFLTAGVLEMVVFALVDPADLRWFGGETIDLEPRAVYTLAFLVFWAVISIGSALSLLLCSPAGDRQGDAAGEGDAGAAGVRQR